MKPCQTCVSYEAYVVRLNAGAGTLARQLVSRWATLARSMNVWVSGRAQAAQLAELTSCPWPGRAIARLLGKNFCACYLTWHLRQAWAPLTFTDEHPPAPGNPVAPARRSPAAQAKAS